MGIQLLIPAVGVTMQLHGSIDHAVTEGGVEMLLTPPYADPHLPDWHHHAVGFQHTTMCIQRLILPTQPDSHTCHEDPRHKFTHVFVFRHDPK